jgi:hypothetical protein
MLLRAVMCCVVGAVRGVVYVAAELYVQSLAVAGCSARRSFDCFGLVRVLTGLTGVTGLQLPMAGAPIPMPPMAPLAPATSL